MLRQRHWEGRDILSLGTPTTHLPKSPHRPLPGREAADGLGHRIRLTRDSVDRVWDFEGRGEAGLGGLAHRLLTGSCGSGAPTSMRGPRIWPRTSRKPLGKLCSTRRHLRLLAFRAAAAKAWRHHALHRGFRRGEARPRQLQCFGADGDIMALKSGGLGA